MDDYPSSFLSYAVNKLPTDLTAMVIPKTPVLCSGLKLFRLGNQQVITICESCLIDQAMRWIYIGL